jgi:hypothetical protein
MSTDYGSATIDARATTGPPGGPAVQPPIGYDKLTGANTEMWNGHIGTDSSVAVDSTRTTAPAAGGYVATPGTLGRDKAGALMTWSTSVAGAAAGATGTLTGSAFVAGAGTAVAQSLIPANGAGWVKN